MGKYKFSKSLRQIDKIKEHIEHELSYSNNNGLKYYYDKETRNYYTDKFAQAEKQMLEKWAKEMEEKLLFAERNKPYDGKTPWYDTSWIGKSYDPIKWITKPQYPGTYNYPDYTTPMRKPDPIIPPPTPEQMKEINQWLEKYKRGIKKVWRPTLQEQMEAQKIKLERQKRNADHRRLAMVTVGQTKFVHAIDEMTGRGYKVDATDGYQMTWMPLPRFVFIRWANLL